MSLLLLILQPQRSYMNALMAELVDALVSKTNEVTLVPVRFRLRVHTTKLNLYKLKHCRGFLFRGYNRGYNENILTIYKFR